jgi:hypothetical protein
MGLGEEVRTAGRSERRFAVFLGDVRAWLQDDRVVRRPGGGQPSVCSARREKKIVMGPGSDHAERLTIKDLRQK